MGLAFMPFWRQKIFHLPRYAFFSLEYSQCIYKFVWAKHMWNKHTQSIEMKKGWWWAWRTHNTRGTAGDRTKHSKRNETKEKKIEWFSEIFSPSCIFHSSGGCRGKHSSERATCYKMLVCHKIHWIIVAVIVAKKSSSNELIFFWDLFIAFTNLLACVSELNIFEL